MVEEGNFILGEKKYAALGSAWRLGRRGLRGTEENEIDTPPSHSLRARNE